MQITHLDLRALRIYDETALQFILYKVAEMRLRPLDRGEVHSIYNEGITLIFTGSGFSNASELNYAIFFQKISRNLPPKLTIRHVVSYSSSHSEVIKYGEPDNLIVAGTLFNGRFSSLSSTWLTRVNLNSGCYSFGLFMNNLVLSYYNVRRTGVNVILRN